MRCAHGLTIVLLILGLFATSIGCRNQQTPLTNPFLTPDRVPPPQTRVLTPGTAQPYYPGDPMPGSAPLAAPMGGIPGTTAAPPATAYPGASPYQSSPVTPTAPITPPNGWGGGYGPRAETSRTNNLAASDAVQVPTDQQQMRFASANAPASPIRTPIQNLVPPSQSELAAAPVDRPFTPNAGSQSAIQQAAYDETPPLSQPLAQRPQIREVTPAEYVIPTTVAATTPSRDGFRPQSDQPRPEVKTESPVNGFRSPSTAGSQVAGAEDKFGVGPSQQWLRGQLEYWPQNGEWSIKYMPDGSVDQIGGRILVDNPQVLGHLPPGEFVMVEGQVFGRQIDDATYRPAYRVAVVQRQRQ